MKIQSTTLILLLMLVFIPTSADDITYTIVDTNQTTFYDASSIVNSSGNFAGQDADYAGAQIDYTDNGDGTVTDLNTGLMWQQGVDDKMTLDEALDGASSFDLAGYSDWRVPTIKELYSLIIFSGLDPSGWQSSDTSQLVPFIDDIFAFEYGDTSAGERIIDAQYLSSTKYVGFTMGGDETVFGVNFADGRIKGYGLTDPQSQGDKTFFVKYVRGNTAYGINNFVDNGDGTISDLATGLMWQKADSGAGMNWQEALEYSESLALAGYDDWRLPNAKELQSIVDYSRSPSTSDSAAIDPIFEISSITDEGGDANYPFFHSSTTHENMQNGEYAVYLAFGEALGWMQPPSGGDYVLMDVHGAGSQRSDPKTGDASEFPYGYGPQGDVIRIDNYVRAVRLQSSPLVDMDLSETSPNTQNADITETSPNTQKSDINDTPFQLGFLVIILVLSRYRRVR